MEKKNYQLPETMEMALNSEGLICNSMLNTIVGSGIDNMDVSSPIDGDSLFD